MTTPRLGFTYPPTLPPEGLQPAARAAEAAGVDEFWLWEDCFQLSGIGSAAAVLGWTSRIPVGIGLLPAPLRNVGLVAMEIATIDRLFPGRFRAGIGHGVQAWMGQAGVRPESPMTLLTEYCDALRRLLDGETVTVSGRYVQLDQVALNWPPLRPPPLLLGGSGRKTLQLSAQRGDGVLLTGIQPTAEAIEHIAIARAAFTAAHGPSRECDITTTMLAATGPGAQERVDREAAVWKQAPDPGVGVAGGPAEIAAAVRRLAELGIAAVSVMPARDEPDVEGLIRVLGQVRELLPQ